MQFDRLFLNPSLSDSREDMLGLVLLLVIYLSGFHVWNEVIPLEYWLTPTHPFYLYFYS